MEDNIKISIILAVYNVEKYLRQALDSLVNQTLKEIEIICVDDCSTDNSYEILQEYARKDNRFVILKQEENQGPGAARNRGLDIAKGEYVMILDPDDWYELDACELCYNQITQNRNDVVLFGYNKYFEEKDLFKPINQMLTPFKPIIKQAQIKLDDVNKNHIVSCYTWAAIYDRKLLEKHNIRYINCRNFEDHVFYIKTIIFADNISILGKFLYNYRIRENSSTFEYYNQAEDIFYARKAIIDTLETNDNISSNKKIAITVNTIDTCLYWLNRYSIMFPEHKKKFYYNIKRIFNLIYKDVINLNIEEHLEKNKYKQYKSICKHNYYQYKAIEIPKNFKDFIYSSFTPILENIFIPDQNFPIINLSILYWLTQWLFPTTKDKNKFKKLCTSIDSRKSIYKTQKNYIKLLEKLKHKKEKITVLFLVSELSKWKAQSLYDLMSKSKCFKPVVAVTPLVKAAKGYDQTRSNISDIYNYFLHKGMNVVYAYKNGKYIDLKTFSPDIIFYEQPWGIDNQQDASKTSKYALLYYIPYYINSYNVIPIDYNKIFHKYMYKHYVLNGEWENIYKKLSKRNNILGLGHPILDKFYLKQDHLNETNKNYVIYAPHYSFKHPNNTNPVMYGTFDWNGYQILEYAQKHPEINWVYKPHPQLKYTMLETGMLPDTIDDYWNEWRKVGIVCEDSSYMDLFLDSKALITDCGSFLTEYFCTQKPLIHLISDDCLIEPNVIAKRNFDTFYKVHNLEEMYETFDQVLIKNEDPLKEKRLKVLEDSGLLNNYAAKNIMEDILKDIS